MMLDEQRFAHVYSVFYFDELVYIGYTTEKLKVRFSKHKNRCKTAEDPFHKFMKERISADKKCNFRIKSIIKIPYDKSKKIDILNLESFYIFMKQPKMNVRKKKKLYFIKKDDRSRIEQREYSSSTNPKK